MKTWIDLYETKANDAKANAQLNLDGRTHYVDEGTLRFHKSRVQYAKAICNGLIFAIITSDALDFENRRRGFRFVLFDVFGNVIERVTLEEACRTRRQADKAMWAAVNALDPKQITLDGIDKTLKAAMEGLEELRGKVNKMEFAK